MRMYVGKAAADYDPREVSRDNVHDTGPESIVQQHLRDEVDINTIVRRFGITGSMPFGAAQPMYADFTGITDYESAVALVRNVDQRFAHLPAELREKFRNNPGELVKFAATVDEAEFVAATTLEPVVPPVPPGEGVST